MESRDNWDQNRVLQDPEMLARLERNLRSAGMKRRTFLAMASAAAGSAALAACGGSSSPTATTAATTGAAPAATVAATRAASSAAAPASTTAAPASTTAASSAPASTTAPAATAAPAATTAASSVTTGSPVAATGPESKKVFIDGGNILAEPVDNDFNRDLYCGGVTQHMSGLLQYDQDFNLLPDLAESFSNNGSVFTFKIRKGATWSDGQPMTAKDFVYSIRRQIDPRTGNGYASFWDSVRHVGSC